VIVDLVEEAVAHGARVEPACEVLGVSTRTVERWRKEPDGEDRREGPKTTPARSARYLGTGEWPRSLDVQPRPSGVAEERAAPAVPWRSALVLRRSRRTALRGIVARVVVAREWAQPRVRETLQMVWDPSDERRDGPTIRALIQKRIG
jgi:hypothetical protein